MSDEIRLTLPYTPPTNRYWRCWRGRMVVSTAAREYKVIVAELAREADIKPLEGAVCIWLDVYRPRKVGDLDGRIKVCLDALNGIAYTDDSQITGIIARRFDIENPKRRKKGDPIDAGRVEVVIQQAE